MSEMKYKKGDKFVIEIQQARKGEFAYPYIMKDLWNEHGRSMNENMLNSLQPLESPQPVWRDGNKDTPKTHEEGAVLIYYVPKANPKLISYLYIYTDTSRTNFYHGETNDMFDAGWHKWSEVLWCYASEFEALMPKMPEEEIKPCPFPECGGKCTLVEDEDEYWIDCLNECGYSSKWYHSASKAIAAHNALGGQ